MAKVNMIRTAFLMAVIVSNQADVIDVKTKGAKADGTTDDGPVIVNAWKEACNGAPPSSLLIPPGTYMAFPPIILSGPCKGPIEINATGATIKAPPELEKFHSDSWILIMYINQLTMTGGTFDGQGHGAWRDKKCKNCQKPVNLRLGFVKDSLFKDMTSLNSKYFHISMLGCDNTRLERITTEAPGNSVNTDGIHIGPTNGLNITNSNMKTGDDCISFGDGTTNIRVDNGVRIKSWPDAHPGNVNNVHFEDIIMDKVANPIIIDQNYCPGRSCKKGVPSKVKISNVRFRNIKGTSTTRVAMKLNCSMFSPCDNVELADIHLTHSGEAQVAATSRCFNVKPKVVGQIVPPACPDAPQQYTATV